MIKFIASDMDGTLLDENGVVTPATKAAIEAFQATGGHFAVCTGRDYGMSKAPIEEAGISCDFICSSGASIYGPDGSVKREIIFQEEQVKSICDLFEDQDLYMELFTDQGRMTTWSKEKAEPYFMGEWQDTQVEGKILPNYDKAAYYADWILSGTSFEMTIEDIFKAGIKVFKICTASMAPDKLSSLKESSLKLGHVVAESSFPQNLELTITGAQKGPSVLAMAQELGIKQDEIMVLGDSDNDLSMLKMDFGMTIAMANGSEEVKKVAKTLTLSNAEEGVAHAINTYILS